MHIIACMLTLILANWLPVKDFTIGPYSSARSLNVLIIGDASRTCLLIYHFMVPTIPIDKK